MARIILPVLEACAMFKKADETYSEYGLVRIDNVPIKALRFVSLEDREDSRFAKQYIMRMPFVDMDALTEEQITKFREALPWTYRLEDDGLLWRTAGSHVQTHFSIDHYSASMRDDYFENSLTPLALPRDDLYNKRVDMLDRSQEGIRAAPIRVGPRGQRDVPKPRMVLSVTEDANTVLYPGEDRTTFWSYDVTVGKTNGGYLETPNEFFDTVMVPVSLNTQFYKNCFRTGSIKAWNEKLKDLLFTGKKMCNKLHLPYDPDFVPPKKGKGANGRNIALEDKDRVKVADFRKMVVSTRDNKASTNFVRLGVRFRDRKPVLTEPNNDLLPFRDPSNNLLIHKAKDGWRFVLMFPIYLKVNSGRGISFGCFPACYMIPQYVDRNEVTFGTKTFRGVNVGTQKKIWDTLGFSMAINRAFMGFTYELTRLANFADSGVLHYSDLPTIPAEHKVALYGMGHLENYQSWTTERLTKIESLDGLSDRGHWQLSFNSHIRFSKPLVHVADILDETFYGIPENELLFPFQEHIREVRVNRTVRI